MSIKYLCKLKRIKRKKGYRERFKVKERRKYKSKKC